ncbi:MAG: hypothetical protein ACHQ1H_08255, partial [Nitrososphaerales archaeon]
MNTMIPASNSESRKVVHLFENSSLSDIHGLDVVRVQQLFEGFGYVCKPQTKLRGISGNVHDFDFECTKKDTGERLILDSLLHLAENQESLEVAMVKLRLKTYDCSPDACIVITSTFSASLRDMATLYKIIAIEASDQSTPYDQLESLLRSREV